MLLAVVVGGLSLGAFLASATAPRVPVAQASSFSRSGAPSENGQGGNRGSAASGNAATSAQQGERGESSQRQGQNTRAIVGSVAAREGDSLTLSTPQGDTKVKLAGAKIQKTVDGATDDLKEGLGIAVTGQQNTDGSYTASIVQILPAESAGQAAAGRAWTVGQGQGTASRPIVGTITSIDGDTVTVTTQQNEARVKVGGAKIQKVVDATADDLAIGVRVSVSGQRDADGSYTATSVQLLPNAESPTRSTPGPSQSVADSTPPAR